jgi:hypothetical protein
LDLRVRGDRREGGAGKEVAVRGVHAVSDDPVPLLFGHYSYGGVAAIEGVARLRRERGSIRIPLRFPDEAHV